MMKRFDHRYYIPGLDRQPVSFRSPIRFMGVVNFNSCKFELPLPQKKIAQFLGLPAGEKRRAELPV